MIIALSGGVGGAKLVEGLATVLPPQELLVVANTGDDFEHLGLKICPDIDTIAYTLAGLSNPSLGWGRADESWNFMETLEGLGGEAWFRLGDRDLALHVLRSHALSEGAALSDVTRALCLKMGVKTKILPMSDDRVRTRLLCAGEWLDFQHWFVRLRCAPTVQEIAFAGVDDARPNPQLMAALAAGPEAVVLCPSNPFVSIGPILALPGLREALLRCAAPVVAVSPMIHGKAVKGPTARMLTDLGHASSAGAVATYYGELLTGFVLEIGDDPGGTGARAFFSNTLMSSSDDKVRLAHAVLAAARALR